ncbi:unnamed protein product [Caretta caretta]
MPTNSGAADLFSAFCSVVHSSFLISFMPAVYSLRENQQEIFIIPDREQNFSHLKGGFSRECEGGGPSREKSPADPGQSLRRPVGGAEQRFAPFAFLFPAVCAEPLETNQPPPGNGFHKEALYDGSSRSSSRHAAVFRNKLHSYVI